MKRYRYLGALLIFLALDAFSFEELTHRHALVIGNQNYAVSPLRNSINDSRAISFRLSELGFQVTAIEDAVASVINAEIKTFYAKIESLIADNDRTKALALVYYAGHAIQIQHRNYLVPLDIKFDSQQVFLSGLYDINRLFAHVPSSPNLQSIILLDACRTNPFSGIDNEHTKLIPSISDGLAPLRAPPGTFIAYATEPGSVASDGKGENGIYTKHLLKHMDKTITVEELFKKVRRGVAKETNKRQIPWEHSSLLEDVFINPPKNREIPELMAF
ncbi:MAG: peptidase C14 caspase catalytic subunit p20 [Moraxellaceae bacterium]|nr:MAG: peptidase C14 caspase catalytic subunit p20 [Moraxellaceae bacterium]